MLKKLALIWKIKDLRKRILFVLAMLAVFRLAAAVPIPGVDADRLSEFFGSEGLGQFFGLLNVFTGGTLENLSIMMLGVGPYITATIIMQLMMMVFPKLKEMYYEQGEQGRQKFNQYSRIFTVPLAAMQGFGFIRLLQNQGVLGQLSALDLFSNIAVVTAGSMLLMWIGELISEKGIGNGISLLIFAGIVAGFPSAVVRTARTWNPEQLPELVAFTALAVLVVAAIAFVAEAQRNVPIAYAKRVRGNKMYGGASANLPIRVNAAGVIPIIFALSIMLFPGIIASFLSTTDLPFAGLATRIQTLLEPTSALYISLYFIFVFAFTYFYTAIIFDPKEIAQNVQRSGGFVPGIRPGEPTAQHLQHIISRTTMIGAVFLGVVAVMPNVAQVFFNLPALTIGGTAILIVVAVVLELVRQIEAQITMREYE